MRRSLLLVCLLPFCFLIACERNPQAPPSQQAAVADAKSAFVIMGGLPLWDLAAGSLTLKESIPLGEKLALLGQTAKAAQSGKDRDFLQVKRDSGKEGWVRADYVVPSSILAVVTADDAVIYTEARNTAATGSLVPKMTVLVIHSDSGGQAFIRVTFYDPAAKVLSRGVQLKNEGVSSRPDDVQAAILFQLAAGSKNQVQKEAFLKSAAKDHPGSAFIVQIQEALVALASPTPSRATEEFFAAMQSTDDGVSVLDAPDEKAGKIVATLSKGQKVDVEAKTTESYSIGELSAPWYRIREPAGWVFSASLAVGEQAQ
jgi:hypothetical protein